MELIMIGVLVAILVAWGLSVRRRLAAMAENINGVMSQIGIQLSSRFEVLIALLEQMKKWEVPEAQEMLNTVKSRQSAVAGDSVPQDVQRQEALLSEVLTGVLAAATQRPALKADENYVKYMKALDGYGNMLSTSRLIYNDSVARLNRELRTFPTSLLGSLFGMKEREYLVTAEGLTRIG